MYLYIYNSADFHIFSLDNVLIRYECFWIQVLSDGINVDHLVTLMLDDPGKVWCFTITMTIARGWSFRDIGIDS